VLVSVDQSSRPPSKASRIAGALLGLALPATFIAIGAYGGIALSHWLVTFDPRYLHWLHTHMTDLVRHQALTIALTYGYLIASTPAGIGFLMERLPQRIVLPLGSPIAWVVLLLAGAAVGYVALPMMVFQRLSKLVSAFRPSPAERFGAALDAGEREGRWRGILTSSARAKTRPDMF
jgi:hypothetical protein